MPRRHDGPEHEHEPPIHSPAVRPGGVGLAPRRRIISRADAQAVDRAAVEAYGLPGIVLMENAARAVADAAMEQLAMARSEAPPSSLIVCGPGNNGGDGYAAARHLHNRGVDVSIIALGSPKPGTDAATNAEVCARMRLPRRDGIEALRAADPDGSRPTLIVDAIFGTGLDRPLRGEALEAVEWINHTVSPVLAVDAPTGLDCETGELLGAAVQAAVTVTFLALKPGLLAIGAHPYVGRLLVGDIGVPRQLIEQYTHRLHEHPAEDDRTDIDADPTGGVHPH